MNVMQQVTNQLAAGMQAKTDEILREAITRFLGRDDWKQEELKDRVAIHRLPSDIEVFCLDGVGLVELHPITVEVKYKTENKVLHATRQHRFLHSSAAD